MGSLIDSSLNFGLQNFIICAQDETDVTYNYYGYQTKKGSTLIMRTNKTATSLKFFIGTGDFDTIWAARAAKVFVYPSALVSPSR